MHGWFARVGAPAKQSATDRHKSAENRFDAACKAIHEPARLADDLKLITGVVEHGLFLDLADEAIIGTDGGVELLTP